MPVAYGDTRAQDSPAFVPFSSKTWYEFSFFAMSSAGFAYVPFLAGGAK